MWFFSRDAAKDFGYEIGPEIAENTDASIWRLHSGKKKSNGDQVSIFICEASLRDSTQSLLDIAKASVKRLKTLRHPSILTYIDSLETDKVVYLVTEKVEPLSTYLNKATHNSSQKKLAISWGLYQIASGLGFLNKDCNLSHNNVCMSSVFVDHAGEWKLFALEHVMPCSERPPPKIVYHLKKYNPPELDSSRGGKVHNWSYDSWGLGCLIWESFNGVLNTNSSLKSLEKIPQNLTSYSELVNENPLSRPSTLAFLKKEYRPKGFFRNRFVETMLFLREMHIKENEEKVKFFNNLSSVLDSFPQDICLYKVLPELVNAFEFGNAGSSVLSPMFKLGKLLTTEEYQNRIVPCIVKMFSSKDRSTRVKLLQQMEQFIHHFTPAIINSQIFPSISQGFLDTSPVIREYTIKCVVPLAPKLNYSNLNEEVLKHLARLQTKDDQGGIRTNTTVCLGKIASYLHPQTRKKVLISAFLRALRDPFPPSRSASILALSATEHYYSINDCATRVLPALCYFTVDPEKSVRDQAFKAIDGFLKKLNKVSEDPSLIEEMEKEIQSVTASEIAASWTSWAVTSLVDKLHMPGLKKSASSSTANVVPKSDLKEERISESKSLEKIDITPKSEEKKESISGLEGWDDDWNNEEEFTDAISSPSPPAEPEAGGDWDNWESFEKDDFQESNKKLSSYFPKDDTEDPFSQISSQIEKASKPLNLCSKTEDSWGDWDEPSPAMTKSQKQSEDRIAREEKKKEREERIKERRQLSKPMKLGLQKIS